MTRVQLSAFGGVAALAFFIVSRASSAEPAAVPTFNRDVAPLLERRCQGCHRPGEVAPFSLLSYDDVRPQARSMKKEVIEKSMPPWHADPRHGAFRNDPTLAPEEIETIVKWVDGGAPEGDPQDRRPQKEWKAGWNIPGPDVVFPMPQEFAVPAQGTIPYKYFQVPTNFTEDRWIQMAEVRPGARDVVHHVLVFIVPSGGKGGRGGLSGNLWDKFLAGMAPGEPPTRFPEGSAKRVPAGSTLVFQVHYTANGKATSDRSSIGLVFAKKPPEREIHTKGVMNQLLLIPPGAENHQVEANYTVGRDSELVSLMPHMHLRGKSFEIHATYPDGREDVLLSVPKYDFNWQHVYLPAKALAMPKGTKIRCIARYDNSPNNKHNPDPTKAVRWGDQTWEEMMLGFIDLSRPVTKAGEEPPAASGRQARL